MAVTETASAPSAGGAHPSSSMAGSATTAVFLALRDALVSRFGVHGACEAFERLVRVEERPVFMSVVRHDILKRFFSGMSAADPAIVRAYLDAKRGMSRPLPKSPNLGAMPVKLTSDPMYFAHCAGALYRVPERISPEDLLRAMRTLDIGDGASDGGRVCGIPGAETTTIDEVRAFINEWDSASYLHRDAGLHVLDFALFMRFARAEEDAVSASTDLGGCEPSQEKARRKVTRHARAAIALKRKRATSDARAVARDREGAMLLDVLREELAVYGGEHSPAVGGFVGGRPMAFKVELAVKGDGSVTAAAKLTPAPTLALALAALDDPCTGFVSPAEAQLALAQCGVALTAAEALVLDDVLSRGAFARSSRSRWAVPELLEALAAPPLPVTRGGALEVTTRWVAGARRAIAEYLKVVGVVSDAELLRFLVAPARAAFGAPAVANVVDASLARRRRLETQLARLDKQLPESSGGSGGEGRLSLTNVKYAAKMAGVTSPTLANNARLATLAAAFPAPSMATAGGTVERCVRWREAVDAAGPLHALLAQEKAVGAAVGATVGLVGAAAGQLEGGIPRVVVSADDPAFDGDVDAALASLAQWLYADVAALRRELEARDAERCGALRVEAFRDAVAAAGYGPEVFGEAEARWALTACHHPVVEGAVSYPKYLAMVLAGIERGVHRR